MVLPKLHPIAKTEIVTDAFLGYVNRLRIRDGAWKDMRGISSQEAPAIASGKPRGKLAVLTQPQGLLGKGALAWVDGGTLYYNNLPVTLPAGMQLTGTGEKQMVGMGAYICIFPDKVYWNTQDASDAGYMEAHFRVHADAGNPISFAPCRWDGSAYEGVFIGQSAPGAPDAGDYWLDTSKEQHGLKVYSQESESWVAIPTVYTRIGAPGIGQAFRQYDGVTISGARYDGEVEFLGDQALALNGSRVLSSCGEDWIAVEGLIDASFTQTQGELAIDRTVPDMDYVIESGNRLWGCKYGMSSGKVVNELYACKLGDFKNWNCFMGLSTDSYIASLGSDGRFTGAITYQGSPHFFKESAIHKVYGNRPANFQIVNVDCRGVQAGSAKSLAIVGNTLFYKSCVDICAYDGSMPVNGSQALGDVQFSKAVGGAWDGRYVISMQDEQGARHMFTFDPSRGMWVRDGARQMLFCASIGEELYYVDSDNILWCASGAQGEREGPVAWELVSGIQGYEYTGKKHIGRWNIRMQLEKGASMDAYFQYDSDGVWHWAAGAKGDGRTRTQHMFIVPRRCDHVQLRLEGAGGMQILSIARELEEASDL